MAPRAGAERLGRPLPDPDGCVALVAALWRLAHKDLARGCPEARAWVLGEDGSGGADFARWVAVAGDRTDAQEARARLLTRYADRTPTR